MNLQKYETLAAVLDTGSLTRAAERMNCTQSAVSHSIAALEEELGFTLIKRGRAGIRLTEEGERLMPSIRNLLNSAEQLGQMASSIRGLDTGIVKIGTFTSVGVHWLPGVLKEFQRDYPGVDFRLFNGDYHDVEQWLEDGSIDIGFVTLPMQANYECITLMEDRLLAILPPDSRFNGYPKFPLVECETEPFISLLESSDHDARRALETAGVKPNVRFYTKDDYAVIALVEQGLGMSIMPELLLKGRKDNVLVLPLIPESKRTIGIAIPAGEKAGPAVRRFADYTVRYVKGEIRGARGKRTCSCSWGSPIWRGGERPAADGRKELRKSRREWDTNFARSATRRDCMKWKSPSGKTRTGAMGSMTEKRRPVLRSAHSSTPIRNGAVSRSWEYPPPKEEARSCSGRKAAFT